MKVAFWNGAGLSGGVSDYMAAIGATLALVHNCKVVLGSTYISNHKLQDYFSSNIKEEGVAHVPYLYLHGSSEYYTALWDMKRSRQGNILEVPMEGVTIIHPPEVTEKKVFYYEVPQTTFYLLDIAGENSKAFQSALDEAEMVVVFLSMNVTEIQNFFQRFSLLIPKTLFILKVFQQKSTVSRCKFSIEYGINIRNIGTFSHNKEFEEACEEGRLESFLRSGLSKSTKEPVYKFISNLKSITNLLYERGSYEQTEGGEHGKWI